MKTALEMFILVSLLFNVSTSRAAEPLIERGQLEQFSFPTLEKNATEIWNFVQKNIEIQLNHIQPLIYIADFNFEKEDSQWVLWQKKWIKENPDIWLDWQRLNPGKTHNDDTNPFPQNFFAFHYDGTDRVQIGFTSVFKKNWVMGPDGVYRDYTGEQYYTLGHELHHVALEAKGIPGLLHHCIFISARKDAKESLVLTLANYLVENKISSSFILSHGYKWEVQLDPCARLNAKDRAEAEAIALKL